MVRRGSKWKWWSWVALVALANVAALASAATIQYAEPVALSLSTAATGFDAYGRRFSITLADNGRVLSKLTATRKAELAPVRVLRGAVDGAPGSWVRLTESSSGIEGAIWDGQELYAVTRYSRVAGELTTPLAVPANQTVVYRLSDMRGALPRDFCAQSSAATLPPDATALDDYRAMMNEVAQITPPVTRQLEIALIGDAALQASDNDPTAAMLARLNIVEGIFSAQLGLLVLATDVRLMPAGGDTLTSTQGATLLEQLGAYRNANAEVRARGIAHLVTGKDLDGNTAGIAYVGSVCKGETGVSISEHAYGTTISALIMAHEIGHNLGASHDGEANTHCAGVTGSFIMAPAVSGAVTFSQCSLDAMTSVLASASCVSPAEFADVTIGSSTTSIAGEGGVAFTLPFLVRSAGNRAAEAATVTVTLPAAAGLVIDSAASSTGSCGVDGLTATCALGTLAPGESHSVSITARGASAASFTAQARVTATNDRIGSNNNQQIAVKLRSGVDAAVRLSASAAELALGAPLELYADVSSQRALPLRNASLTLNATQPITSATLAGSPCSVSAFAVSCSIAELPAGATRRLTVQLTAVSGGPLYASAGVSVAGDGDLGNNNSNLPLWVQPAHDIDVGASAGTYTLGVGASYDVAFTLRSRGAGTTEDVTLNVGILSTALIVTAVDAGGGSCAPAEDTALRCRFGALAPGQARVVRLRVQGIRPVNCDLVATAVTANDGYAANDSAVVHLQIDHAVDLAVTMASGGNGVEGRVVDGQATLRSSGRNAARGATLDVTLHSAGTLRSVDIHGGDACTLLTPRHARCALPAIARNAQLYVDYQAEFADAGTYDVTFAAAAPGDTAPENDSLTRAVLVRSNTDVGITGGLNLTDLVIGQVRERTFTVTTARRAVATARFVAPHYLPGLRVESVRASVGDCRVDPVDGGICDFVDLPADASMAVTVTYRAEAAPYGYDIAAAVSAPGDISAFNDAVRGRAETHGMTDLELRVATSVGGAKNATLTFPEISLVNGAEKALGTRLEVTLPPEVALVDISAANAICSGATVLRCEFSALASQSMSTVQLTVRPAADGRFKATVKLTAANAPNEAREVAIEVASGSSAPAVSGGKGGGRMEWVTLLVLLLLVGSRSGGSWCRVRKSGGNGDVSEMEMGTFLIS